jgi:GNAT superfamily N-acetyltransferase
VTWQTTDQPAARDALAIDQGLDLFNQASADLASVRPLACFARLSEEELIGGVIGRTWGRCCELQQIWVAERFRRHGVGSRLVSHFEQAARQRGCSLVYLETFSFQSPDLYRRLGFKTACQFAGFADGVVKYVMQKKLTSA